MLFTKYGSMLDDLSFVHFYHSHPANYAYHLVLTPIMWFGFFVIPAAAVSYLLPVVLGIFYFAIYASQSIPVALLTALYWACAGELAEVVLATWPRHDLYVVLASLILGGVAGAPQVMIGHWRYQKANPAFDAWEFLFIAPFYFVLRALFAVGYRPEWQKEIYTHSRQWAAKQ